MAFITNVRDILFVNLLVASVAGRVQAQPDTVYINPNYSGTSSTGSFSQPYKHWRDLPNNANLRVNTVYAQYRGSTDTITRAIAAVLQPNITIGVYGPGSDYAHLYSPTSGIKLISLAAANHGRIDGYHLKGTYQSSCAIEVTGYYQQTSTTGHNITIANCFIEEQGWGIRVFKRGTTAADTLTIENTRVRRTNDDGMFMQTLDGTTLSDIDINNCHIDSVNMQYDPGELESQAGGDGIQFSGAFDRIRIRNTIIDRSASTWKACVIANGATSGAFTATIENCSFFAPDSGGCLYLDHTNTEIGSCRFTVGSASYGILSRSSASITLHHNLFTHPGSAGSLRLLDYSTGTHNLYNNTFFGVQVLFQNGVPAHVKNNIFSNVTTVFRTTTGIDKDYNLYYNAGGTGATETHSQYNANPLFTHEGVDFTLRAGSPCIDRGINVGYSADMIATALPQGVTYDLGAYEHIDVSAVMPARVLPHPEVDLLGARFSDQRLNVRTRAPGILSVVAVNGRVVFTAPIEPGSYTPLPRIGAGRYVIGLRESNGRSHWVRSE